MRGRIDQKYDKFRSKQYRNAVEYTLRTRQSYLKCGKRANIEFLPEKMNFICVRVLKHGNQSDVLERVLTKKAPNFKRIIETFVMLISGHCYKIFVSDIAHVNTMSTLRENRQLLNKFNYPRYATDVTLQQSFRPSGSIE